MADDPNAVSKDLALRDIQNIKALRESDPFRQYWLRRLQDRHAAALDSLIHDPVTKIVTRRADGRDTQVEIPFCTKDRREEIRQVVLAYESLLGMMDDDYAACSRMLQERLEAQSPGMR
jgi:hypothetical protein